MVTCKPGFSWLLPNYCISRWRSAEQIVVRGWCWAAHSFTLLTNLSPFNTTMSEVCQIFPILHYMVVLLQDTEFLDKLGHITLHLSLLVVFWIKISFSKIKDNFGSSEEKTALPFYSFPCLFCCQFCLNMALFAKATILLNELLLILFLVCLHKWKMKDGKYRSEKTVRDKKHESIKRNVKCSQTCTTHNHSALWQKVDPWKSSQWTHRGPRSLGSLDRELALAVLQLDLGVSWGMSFTDCSVGKVL